MYKISDTTTALIAAIEAAFTVDGSLTVKVKQGDPEKMKLLNIGVPYVVVQEGKWIPNDSDLGAMARANHEASFKVHVFVYSSDPDAGHASRVSLVEDLVAMFRTNPSIGGAVDFTVIDQADLDAEFPGENDTGYAGLVEITTRKLSL